MPSHTPKERKKKHINQRRAPRTTQQIKERYGIIPKRLGLQPNNNTHSSIVAASIY